MSVKEDIWAASRQNQQNDCAPNEDSDQPRLPPVWLESSLYAPWVAKDPSFLHADSEDSDQTFRLAHMQFCWFCHVAAHINKCRLHNTKHANNSYNLASSNGRSKHNHNYTTDSSKHFLNSNAVLYYWRIRRILDVVLVDRCISCRVEGMILYLQIELWMLNKFNCTSGVIAGRTDVVRLSWNWNL